MNKTWKFLATSSLVTALLVSGCTTPKAMNGPAGLSTQQLHNIAQPQSSSWLLKFMQPSADQPKFGGNGEISNLATSADQASSKIPKPRKVDPLTMARLQERRGQFAQAAAVYERELPTNPKKAHIHHRLAVIAAREGRWDKARGHFTEACRLEPRNSEILGDLGYALYLQHQLTEAESCLIAAVEANPNDKSAQNNLGIVLGVQGKYEQSLVAFRRAVPDAEAHANLGYVHMQLGDAEKAMEELNQALSLDSSLKTAAIALVQMNDLKKRLGPQDLERMSLAARQTKNVLPSSDLHVPTTEVAPSEEVAAVNADPPQAGVAQLAAASTPAVTRVPMAMPAPPPAERLSVPPSLSQRQVAVHSPRESRVPHLERSTPSDQPPVAEIDSRIKEIPERLPAPSSFVSLSGLGSKVETRDSVTPKFISGSGAHLLAKSEGSGPIPTSADPEASVIQVSAQVNMAPALLKAPLVNGESSSTTRRNSSSQPVPVYKPSPRLQSLRDEARAAAEARQRSTSPDMFSLAKLNEDRISLSAEDVVVGKEGVLAQSAVLLANKPAAAHAELARAVQGAQAVSSKSAVVKPTTGAVPTLAPQTAMPRPEDMIPANAHQNQLPTHQLHPTASPTWSAPSTIAPTVNPSTRSTKGSLPGWQVQSQLPPTRNWHSRSRHIARPNHRCAERTRTTGRSER